MSDDTPTRQHRRIPTSLDARLLTLPAVTVMACILFAASAGATWAGDRSELQANTQGRVDHGKRLRAVEETVIEQTTVLRGILKALESIERKMEARP